MHVAYQAACAIAIFAGVLTAIHGGPKHGLALAAIGLLLICAA